MEVEVDEISNEEQAEIESRSLEYILGGKVAEFFDVVWQNSCAVFPFVSPRRESSENKLPDDSNPWNWEILHKNPFQTLVQHSFFVLENLMEQTHAILPNGASTDPCEPLLFRDQQLITKDESALYRYTDSDDGRSVNLWAAFLDGCSVVINHVDIQSPWIAALCTDMQRSVPHAYANAYITPAQSQTVPPHADDRDVFIIQIYGRKQWTVYGTVPIPLPYPHEQVGKSDELPVPDSVLKGPVLIQRILSPGDVLYMPRGYVHEARSCDDSCSFHVTVAIATHDWTMAGLFTEATQSILSQQIDLRRAIHRSIGRRGRSSPRIEPSVYASLQRQIDQALQLLLNECTVSSIDTTLSRKFERHNQRAEALRERLFAPMSQTNLAGHGTSAATPLQCPVGKVAAAGVTLSTWLRAATAEEKDKLTNQQRQQNRVKTTKGHDETSNQQQVGLHVRSEIYDDVIAMIQYLKHDSTRRCELRLLPTVTAKDMQQNDAGGTKGDCLCDLTLVSVGRRCVELGALSVVILDVNSVECRHDGL